MANTTIRIEGLDRVLKKINTLEELKPIKDALKAGAVHVKGKIAKYPPASEANRRGRSVFYGGSISYRWYQRGYGPMWIRRRDGSIAGKKTSETLGRRWTTASRNRGLTWIVGNNVSYGPFVQDKDRQAAFHKVRGWKTTEEVAEEEAKTVLEFIEKEVEKVLEKRT